MAGFYNNFKLADGYALDATDGYGYASDWTDIASFDNFSVTAVFTGGVPAGTVKLQQSNDLQWTGTGSPIRPLHVGNTQFVDDTADVPSGTGTVSAVVAGPGAYVMNQFMVGYRWFRVVFTPSGNHNTTLDILVTIKKG